MNKYFKFINIFIVICLLTLPYFIFEGKLYVGGDDTRLFYAYPFAFLKNVAYFSWYNVSSVGINVSNQFILPFLSIWSILDMFIGNKIILSYFGFSLPLIFGFIYFKKFVSKLFNLDHSYSLELIIGSLCYILSPIIIFDQLSIFLTPVWLLGVVPAVGYYFLKYLKTSKFLYVYIPLIICFIFSFTLMTIPWLLGYLLPMLFGAIVLTFLSKRKELVLVIRRGILFSGVILLAQSFWLLGFLAPYIIHDKTSFAVKFLSKGFLDTFAPTVISTATGYIIYPLLNLYHRQIAFDFNWQLKNAFINLYDKTFFLNLIFIAVIAIGLLSYKKYLDKENRSKYLFILTSVLLSLYFFTVNIGPLKNLFLILGKIPGFVMFRNFYDKFAPGFIFLYSIFITINLVVVKKRYPQKYIWINLLLICIIVLNFTTVKSTVNAPLWTTDNVYKTMNMPKEYLNFMNSVEKKVSPTNNILSIPFGAAIYTVIKDEKTNDVYLGSSPVKIFSGVNDISGYLSFNFAKEADVIDQIIIERNYDKLNKIIYDRNINYVLITKNIPKQVLKSYAFNKYTLAKQDNKFIEAITDKKIGTSEKGNYELYTTKKRNSLLQSKNLYFKKISGVKYIIYIKNMTGPQRLTFNDTYHNDWKIYLNSPDLSFCRKIIDHNTNNTKECKSEFNFFDPIDMTYLWRKPLFSNSHSTIDGSSNMWIIDPKYIKNNFNKNYYRVNQDGSIDAEMVMYFKPQLYLYYGLIISFVIIILSTGYLFISLRKKDEKRK